jgi:hypothetical protein
VAVNGSHIYWANQNAGTIGVANLDGTGVNQSLITGASSPDGVAVDGQHIYWTNFGSGTIGVANLDGTGVNESLISGAVFPVGVAVDGRHIYWTNDTFPGTIGVANLDGTDVNESLITASGFPRGVAVDSQHVYWANGNASALGEANLDGSAVNESFVPLALNASGVDVSVPVAQVTPASPSAFATTPQGTLSPSLTLTVSNGGQRNLSIAGLSFSGSDPADFLISSNGCLGSVAPGESCTLTVTFAPQAQGVRSATLQIASNDYADSPLSVPLSGTGDSLPAGSLGAQGPHGASGPQGATGTKGATGVTGAQGSEGSAGKIELITCKTVTKKIKGHRRTTELCTGRLVSGKASFTTAASDRATISRGRTVFAIGASVQLGGGRSVVLLDHPRVLRRGRYTLTLHARHGSRRVTKRLAITIG